MDGELGFSTVKGARQFDGVSKRARRTRQLAIDHGARADPAGLFVFDVLELDSEDVRSRPLNERKALLKQVTNDAGGVRYTATSTISASKVSSGRRGPIKGTSAVACVNFATLLGIVFVR
jgi:ATP-dependent DNA ligase